MTLRGATHLYAFLLLGLVFLHQSISLVVAGSEHNVLAKAVARARDVKAFAETIGIEPSDSLSASTLARPGVSRLWIWLQKKGTLATLTPMDFVLQLGFSREREKVPLDSIRHWDEVGRYSYYWRHSSEFESDEDASAITIDFATQTLRRQVEVVLHEDLHANAPFKLWPFRVAEGIVTPLADLAALAFFRSRGDHANAEATEGHIREQRKLSRELNRLVSNMRGLFVQGPLESARKRALREVESAPVYSRFFEHHVENQSRDVLLEAKVSHDWAYYGSYAAVLDVYDRHGRDIEELIAVFKYAPTGGTALEGFFGELHGH